MAIHLTPRLQSVAALVPPGARVIDVGTDHAKLPVWLVQSGQIEYAWASDIRRGPLKSAERLIHETGTEDRIHIRLTDGLQGFGPESGDTVVMAGMGGETMCSVLDAAPWTKNDTLLILEPQSKQAFLRSWLCARGYRIIHESLVKDAGHIYPLLMARGGAPDEFSLMELHTGRMALIGADPLLGELLAQLIARARAAAPYDENARLLLRELMERKERISI